MATTIAVQVTPQGLLIPRTALGDWYMKELEAVWEKREIVIRPRPTPADVRSQVRQALRVAGMLYEPHWETPPPVSPEERARLAKKLAQGQSLSEIIIAEREDRA
jgi:hypothetical protein